jgi:putative transposase
VELLIKKDSHWEFPTGEYRFDSALADDLLLFHKVPTAEVKFVPKDEFRKLLGEAKAFEIKYYKRRQPFFDAEGEKHFREVNQAANENADFGPDEEDSREALRARTFQFYVREWDKDPSISLGRRSLAVFIHRLRPDAERRGLTHNVKPARLYEAIKNCGSPRDRPLRLFRSRRGKGTRKRLDPFVLQALDNAVVEYWRDRTWDYNDAYAQFRGDMRRENEAREIEKKPKLAYPRRMETLRRRINASINHANWTTKYGAREADRKFKGTRPGLAAERPLELVIMDHSTVDTWTVLDTSTYIPFKQRATLTVAVDVATRMPLGHLITFEPPSLYSVMTTLKRVNKNKDYIAKIFSDIQGTWDGWGHPEAILVDNGLEFTSPSFQDALADIGTEVIWAPVRTPEYKAIGERFFGTLKSMLEHKLTGSVPYDPVTRSALGLKPEDEAVISLGELDRLIHQTFIAYSNQFHTGIDAIPARLWNEKIQRHGRRFIPDIRQMNAMLGRVGTGVLTRHGVRFENMRFHDQETTTQLLNDMTRAEPIRSQSIRRISSAKVKIKFKYNPADASSIEIWNHGGTPKHYASLPNVSRRFTESLSFWQAANIRAHALEKNMPFDTEEQKWAAREALREAYDRLAGKKMRETRDARRSAAQTMGTYEEVDNLPGPQPTSIRTDEVIIDVSESETSVVPNEVPTEMPAMDRMDDTAPVAGFAPSKASQAKAKKTRVANEAERVRNERAEAKAKAASEQTAPLDLNGSGSNSYKDRLRSRLKWIDK